MAKKADLYESSQRRLVASLLYHREDEDAIEEVAPVLSMVTADDFEDPAMNTIFKAINRVVSKSESPTPVTVARELEHVGALSRLGGVSELYELQKEGRKARLEAPSFFYAEEVKKGSVRRIVSGELEEVKPFLEADSGRSVTEVVSGLANSLNSELNRMSDDSTTGELADAIGGYGKLLALRKERSEANGGEEGGGLQGLVTPLPTLNKYTTGWLPEQLITIGARTGIGKSIFAVNAATAAASAGASVLFFSLEMSEEELVDRLVSSITQVSQSRLKNGYVTSEDLERIEARADDIQNMKITIDTDPYVTVDTIRAKAMQAKQSKAGLDFIIVDYLQLVTGGSSGSRSETRQEIVSNLSRDMKLLAKQLKIPIMVLVQLNRAGSKDEENPLPTLENIRESDAVAQNSNVVILLHRDKEVSNEADPPKTKVILAKNRNGPTNRTITCSSFLSTSTFKETVSSAESILENEDDVDALLDDGLEDLDFDDLSDSDFDDTEDDFDWED